MENNVAWNRVPLAQWLHKWTQGWWEVLHLNISHNCTDWDANPYQQSGNYKTIHIVTGSGHDPTGLGQFCWTTYQGKDQLLLRVVAGYRPCKNSNGHLSVLQQHWRFFDQQPEQREHPRTTFWTDLQPQLQEWTAQGDHIIMGLDANEDIWDPDIKTFFSELVCQNSS